ncbi:uncharacterized protein LOC143233546 isoform X2 [Tachypleus tridentatus]|uniref:uncharacterized protein LOC143233546 isoform X2 n=1 Tax=Tachypleus tridentatus TaxID=6853 RepID=UPI003FD402BF
MMRYFIQPELPSHLHDDLLEKQWRCGPEAQGDMVSRRRIISRSRDELNLDFGLLEDEDIWYQKERLYKDHIQEILNKWEQIDDEIWAKVICMERNRRVAKAYARSPVLTINGSDDGFDGYRIGLCGFDNPMRDPKTEEMKRNIGHGVKVKMDDSGNIIIKRTSKSNVFVKEIDNEENSVASEVIRNNGLLEHDKAVKLFDMKKFQQNISRELKRAYPDRRKLENQCICAVAFVRDSDKILDCSCWVMIINIVALDMLKSKLPPRQQLRIPNPVYEQVSKRRSVPNLASLFERSRLQDQEENPYSIPTNLVNFSSRGLSALREKPPKLPPRDVPRVPVPKPDYESDINENKIKTPSISQNGRNRKSSIYDDPYYCGLRARVPNYSKKGAEYMKKTHSSSYLSLLRALDRSPNHTSLGSDSLGSSEDEYARIYGRLRGDLPPREMYLRKWE